MRFPLLQEGSKLMDFRHERTLPNLEPAGLGLEPLTDLAGKREVVLQRCKPGIDRFGRFFRLEARVS